MLPSESSGLSQPLAGRQFTRGELKIATLQLTGFTSFDGHPPKLRALTFIPRFN